MGELAANAVHHAGDDFTVGLARRAHGSRLMVGDASREPPVLKDGGSTSPRGRGLRIVEALADTSGWNEHETGQGLWVGLLASSMS